MGSSTDADGQERGQGLGEADARRLKLAHGLLQHPSLTAKIANLLGRPIEYGLDLLPGKASGIVATATRKAIHASLKVALMTLRTAGQDEEPPSNVWHKIGAAATGGVGGFFGLAAVTLELPVTTTIIMRSIADIARSEGADLDDREIQLECVQVLALGGKSDKDDAADVGYFATREAMAKAAADAALFLAKGGKVAGTSAPALLRLINLVAQRFGITVTEKIAVQAVPVIGAAAGAVINTAFMDHYQDMARGHFIMLGLERKYGREVVRAEYDRLSRKRR